MDKKSKGGRPTSFQDKYTDMLIQYFDIEPYRVIMKKVVTKSGDVIEVPVDEANDFPSLAGFAVLIGVHRDTLHEWSRATDEKGKLKHPKFSDAYKRAKDFQENYLLVNGNKGLLQPAMGIFTMKNVLNYKDKQSIETTPDQDTQDQLKSMAEELRRIAKKPND